MVNEYVGRFDYLNPTHTDIHRTVMDFVQDSDSLASQSVESPRSVYFYSKHVKFVFEEMNHIVSPMKF